MIAMEGKFSEFSCEIVDGKQLIQAMYKVQGISFPCTLNEQKDGKTLRGRVSVQDVNTGMVMQVTGREREERLTKNCKADLTIFKEVTCKKYPEKKKPERVVTAKEVKEKFKNKVEAIICDHKDCIIESLSSLIKGDLHPMTSGYVCRRGFFEAYYPKQSLADREKKEKYLDEICRQLPDKKLNTMGEKDIVALYEEFGSTKATKERVKLLGQYLAYCVGWEKDENPCFLYLEDIETHVKKVGEKQMKEAFRPKSLQQDENVMLNQMIADAAPDNGLVTGFLLAKELGLSNAKVVKLTWNDVQWESMSFPFVRVVQMNDTNAGATHNYTKPCTPFLGKELHRRYEWAMEQYGENVSDQPVVAKSENRKVETKALGEFVKTAIAQVKNSLEREVGGEGAMFLQTNYEHCLVYARGLPAEGGAIGYMKGQSLSGDVTADHYRSFSSPEGQRYLFGYLHRDDPTMMRSEETPVYEVSSDQKTHTVHSVEAGRFAQVQGEVFVPAGSPLMIRAEFGVNGEISLPKVQEEVEEQQRTEGLKKWPAKQKEEMNSISDQLTMFGDHE